MQSLLISAHFSEPRVLITVVEIQLRRDQKTNGVMQTGKDMLFIRVIKNIYMNTILFLNLNAVFIGL